MMKRPLILVGGGGHCKSVIDVAESAGYEIIVVLDLQGIVSLALPIGHVAEVEIPQVIKEPSPDSLERDHLQPAVGIPERDQAL